MINLNSKIYVAGHTGLVGSAILRKLKRKGYRNVIYRTRNELDLKNQIKVYNFLKKHKPDFIFIAAAKVGGIYSNNKYKADFIYDNISIQSNLIHSAYKNGINNIIFLGSSCVYPRNCKQPIKESYLLSGELEKTNDAYAIAKIAGIKMCEAYRNQYGCDYISAQPNNLYGPGDNFDLKRGHVIPALIHKTHLAKLNDDKALNVWGTGTVKREFLHVDDCADALIHLIKFYSGIQQVNIGTGKEITIKELAHYISKVIGYKGDLKFDSNMPDGSPRKLLDHSRMKSLNWSATIGLEDGLNSTYQWFQKNFAD